MNFKIINGSEAARYSVKESQADGIISLFVEMHTEQAKIPEQFTVQWEFSGADCCCLWTPFERCHSLRSDWGQLKNRSRLACSMPIGQIVSFTDKNKLCIAVSDVDTPISVNMGYIEERGNILCSVDFFTAPTNETTDYSATIRLDTRNVDFYDSIYDTAAWWENDCGYKSAAVPEAAREPMDSLWYSFHQQLEHDKIIEECKNSKALGMESVIIDDGWQTDDNSRGYAYCGDWQVCKKKMGDMRALTEKIHNIGMKVILWYSVPFVGMYSDKYEEFKGCYLDGCGNAGTSFALDPRYKKVREFLIGVYEAAVRDWGLDGLKLDFIDSFRLQGESLKYDPARDYQSLEEALHALMGEVKTRLTAVNPDILIEFRQCYVGPSIRKYGNMLRVGDCPGDIVTNRSQIINLRMTSGKTAVHSDMIMWNKQDSAENAAMQFASVIFAVPQISVVINDLPPEHIEMLSYYISFWKEHKSVLLDGKLVAGGVENDYSFAAATLGEKSIAALYTNGFFEVKTDYAAIVNAGGFESIVLKAEPGKSYMVADCRGREQCRGKTENSLTQINVPKSGIIFVS